MTSSTPIVPTYRALTIVGNVLQQDQDGDMHHIVVVSTTLTSNVQVTYKVVSRQ
ncbi:MAG: hypothetical protein KA941_11515 [Flavobacteriales bacterium]|nr:hypothetical protein [Flavobacteriales bacterium]